MIPAGTITAPGWYEITSTSVGLTLGAGCAGVYTNDITIGYGAPVTACITSAGAVPPPTNPPADSDLDYNGTPLTGNYCGTSLSFTITPINPAFSVDKSVQGNLDAAPVTAGGTGDVSPTGGTASYDVTFANTGATNLVDPVLYDLLPRVGDTFATSARSRGSQFGVTLTGVGPVPPGGTVYYSTAANPCRPEVLPANPGCVSDWSTTPPSPLSPVTALEFAYTGTVYVNGGNGPNSISVPFTVAVASASPGDVAKNSVGATAMPGAGEPLMTPAESSVTGLKAATLGLVKSARPRRAGARGGRRDHLRLHGDQHRQRHPVRHRGHRHPGSPGGAADADRYLPGHHAGARGVRDVHRDLHRHPGRRRQRAA